MAEDSGALLDRLIKGDKRAIARVISLLENQSSQRAFLLDKLDTVAADTAWIIGITGAPGAGKSSLSDCLIAEIRREGLTCAVIAIDPASPFSGGAILGDRIRMQNHALDEGVFIRSMSSRGYMGGLSAATADAMKVLAAADYDVIIIETVGVGQSELDVMNLADSTVVVLTPGMGDYIQTIKAGIMEIADVFAVNKADLPGADAVAMETEGMLALRRDKSWQPPVCLVSSIKEQGVNMLWQALKTHKEHLLANDLYAQKRRRLRLDEVNRYLELTVKQKLLAIIDSGEVAALMQDVADARLSAVAAAAIIMDKYIKI